MMTRHPLADLVGEGADLGVDARALHTGCLRHRGARGPGELLAGGAEVEVPTLSGRKKLRVPPGTKHGTVQRLRGEGPMRLGGKGRGDIHYRFVIDVQGR